MIMVLKAFILFPSKSAWWPIPLLFFSSLSTKLNMNTDERDKAVQRMQYVYWNYHTSNNEWGTISEPPAPNFIEHLISQTYSVHLLCAVSWISFLAESTHKSTYGLSLIACINWSCENIQLTVTIIQEIVLLIKEVQEFSETQIIIFTIF